MKIKGISKISFLKDFYLLREVLKCLFDKELKKKLRQFLEDNKKTNITFNVVDTSLINAKKFVSIIEELEQQGNIIFTSVTRKELDHIQFINGQLAYNSRILLNGVAQKPSIYKATLIDENDSSGDDAILKYCIEKNSDANVRVILHTCDKNFAIQTRENGVEAKFYEHLNKNKSAEEKERIITEKNFLNIRVFRGQLTISNMFGQNYMVKVISHGFPHNGREIKLTKGDDILLLYKKKKENCYQLSHYKIVGYNLNSCYELVNSITLSSLEEKTDNKMYNDFIRIYKRTH